MAKRDRKSLVVIDGATGTATPPPPPPKRRQFRLTSLAAVRKEMAGVYADMRNKDIDTQDGTRLVYALSCIGKVIEVADLEQRLAILEGGGSGRLEIED